MTSQAMTIMIQGTASNVGKSLIAAGLCRVFHNRGLKVAPFKAWNMSSNSYLTEDNIEIGIGQTIQAIAAGCRPDVKFHPVLVKPLGDGKTELYLNGIRQGQYQFGDSDHQLNLKINEAINKSLDILKSEFDLIIFEGSGSPVELNRVGPDFGNMFAARLNNTPVFLTADISRGGALADLVGTLKLLSSEDRNLVKGLIINKFRGDFELLKPGLDFLEKYTGKQVLGTVPYLQKVNLPEEDTSPHLQLDQSTDLTYLEEEIENIAQQLEESLQIDSILNLARRDRNG